MSDPNPSLLLNLGCGNRTHPAWVNIDLLSWRPDVIAADLSRGIPFPDCRFAAVYHSAMLEHLRREDVAPFLRECRRVLRPGGILRIGVPDLETICRLYLQALEAAAADSAAEPDLEWMTIELLDQAVRERSGGGMIDYLARQPLPNERFVLSRIGHEGTELLEQIRTRRADVPVPEERAPTWWRRLRKRIRRRLLERLIGPDGDRALAIGRFRLSGEIHQWMYDRVSLARHLLDAGFVGPRRCAATESGIPDWPTYLLDTLESGAPRKPDLFYMEATKP
jgi:SAM-dependent methyltransferase